MRIPSPRLASFAVGLACALLPLASLGWSWRPEVFEPQHRLSGIGADRENLSELVLAARTERMIDSQTFSILRDPQALQGAQRITSPKLQKIFAAAAAKSGLPTSLISAISYLESWGEPQAESPAGPKGIMQVSEATAHDMGLQIIRAKRYRVAIEKVQVRSKKGKLATRTVKRRTPYTVTVRDERLIPERAIPAAAMHLARLEQSLGGRDWAVFAYHCGAGCVREFQELAGQAFGSKQEPTVAKLFFSANPARHKELYRAIQHHMSRDYSPTYWFRIMKAQQLLKLYTENPAQFRTLFEEYRYRVNPTQRAPHRLTVWLKPEDVEYETCEDLRRQSGKKLMKALDRPQFFGFQLRKTGRGAIGEFDLTNQDAYLQATPAALGTLAYIAFETRRLHEAWHPKGESFVPLEVTSLVRPRAYQEKLAINELPAHCTGQVFDLNYSRLPPGERECLQFVLDDMGWDGYLGFVLDVDATDTIHVGCAPSAREFFTQVWQDALSHES